MLKIIRDLLWQVIENIDAGNSKIPEDKQYEVIEYLKEFINVDRPMSKYEAYTYLKISRSTFDNHIARGWLPKGKPMPGFKELA